MRYEDWTLDELRAECSKRNLKFSDGTSSQDLVNILIKHDSKPVDWGKIYSRVLYNTGMGYEEIGKRSIAQIEALLDEADENISLKMGIPNMFGMATSSHSTAAEPLADSPPKLSQFMNFANAFN